MPKSIEVPIKPKIVVGDELKDFAECLKRIAAPHEKPRTEEIRFLNAVLATFTRIADALDAIHGTLAEATRPDIEVKVKEAEDGE